MITKHKMCRVKDLPTCLFSSLMFTGLPNHFSLLSMVLKMFLSTAWRIKIPVPISRTSYETASLILCSLGISYGQYVVNKTILVHVIVVQMKWNLDF